MAKYRLTKNALSVGGKGSPWKIVGDGVFECEDKTCADVAASNKWQIQVYDEKKKDWITYEPKKG
jgi:hypothetical protein